MTLLRNRPGTKAEDFSFWTHQNLEDVDSAFALQEHLQSIIRLHQSSKPLLLSTEDDTKPQPLTLEGIVATPKDQDTDVWQYEHLRQLCLELNQLVVQLLPECNKESCPEMRAGEYLYLCAAHNSPEPCCAIDYIIHTLDGATSLLNSNKHFPSRVSVPEASVKQYQLVARRLYRIFAHAWWQHREVFDSFENETDLHARFLLLSKKYGILPDSFLVIEHALQQQKPSEEHPRS